MSNLPTLLERYQRLKVSTPGNREKTQFEFTMGPPKVESAHITAMPAYMRRILSEVDFALRLNTEAGGAYDSTIDEALTALESSQRDLGAVTKPVADEAERILLPLADAAKEYEILCASHAHIDMNWMWGWEETVAATLATFRTILGLMDEYPEFTYSQSQASVYKIVEDYAPEMMAAIQRRIAEKRWEVTAAAWVETDKNMPDTESLIRHIEQTRKYLHVFWGINPASLKVDFSPDTFGHSAHLPELNSFGSVPYYYHCRGHQTDNILYRWRAPSGSEIMIYMEPYWYNSGIVPDIGLGVIEASKKSGGLKTGLIVYGVGDHGGGPTRRDVERIIEMKQWPIFPRVNFGTLREYFRRAESVRENLPVADYELNTIFAGCYTTQSRIKRGNRRAEAALLDAEAMLARAAIETKSIRSTATDAHRAMLDDAWRGVLFTHFHDILTGSCVQSSREHAMGLYQHAMAVAQSRQEAAARTLSEAIDTSTIPFDADDGTQSEGAGAGYGIDAFAGMPRPERGRGRVRVFHVFNPLPIARAENVELTLWDWTYDLNRLTVANADSVQLPYQLLDQQPVRYWDHHYIRILVSVNVPALGHTTVVVSEKRVTDYPIFRYTGDRIQLPLGDFVLENDHLRVVIDGQSGGIKSYFDKKSNTERIRPGMLAGLALIQTEADTSNAWRIGRYLGKRPVTDCKRISEEKGELRRTVTMEHSILNSTAKTVISLDDGAAELAVSLHVDWNETSYHKDSAPVLVWSVPLPTKPDTIRMDVPAGSQDRAQTAQDWAGLTHAAAVYGENALVLVSDCKYGYRADNDELAVTLINTASSPDPHPERGIHTIKLWMAAADSTATALKAVGQRLNHNLYYVSATKHGGTLPSHGEFIHVEGPCVVTSIGLDDSGALRIRLYESEGNDGKVSVITPYTIKDCAVTNLSGNSIAIAEISGGTAYLSIKPHKMYELHLR
ncbi:alpha-mannosidase [Clostridia bacterium]|nr:alpha-mannosidase [Clostridia bacterium]